MAHPSDTTDPDAVQGLMDTVTSRHGRLDGLVVDAATGRPGAAGDVTPED
ncbi:hypothetical protein ABT247_03935 [Kitasatospora sp. NPDC001539]